MSVTARDRRSRGFTLLELLVVMTILAMLSAAVGTFAMRYLGGAKSDTTALKVQQAMAALDYFRLDVGRYPTQAEGLQALLRAPDGLAGWNGPYVQKPDALIDAWGAPLRYQMPGSANPVDVYSLGSDDAQGGEDEAADITSWN